MNLTIIFTFHHLVSSSFPLEFSLLVSAFVLLCNCWFQLANISRVPRTSIIIVATLNAVHLPWSLAHTLFILIRFNSAHFPHFQFRTL